MRGLSVDQAAHQGKITRRLVEAVSGATSNEEAKTVAIRILTESDAKPEIIARLVAMVSSPWSGS